MSDEGDSGPVAVAPVRKKHMGGRPPYAPTEEQRYAVDRMASVGIPHDTIAKAIGIDCETMKKYYRPELDTAALTANVNVARSLYDQAISGNVSAAIFWCKTKLKWRDVTSVELTGLDGAPLKLVDVPPNETREQWLARKKLELLIDAPIKLLAED